MLHPVLSYTRSPASSKQRYRPHTSLPVAACTKHRTNGTSCPSMRSTLAGWPPATWLAAAPSLHPPLVDTSSSKPPSRTLPPTRRPHSIVGGPGSFRNGPRGLATQQLPLLLPQDASTRQLQRKLLRSCVATSQPKSCPPQPEVQPGHCQPHWSSRAPRVVTLDAAAATRQLPFSGPRNMTALTNSIV